MDEIGSDPTSPRRRHLLPAEQVTRAAFASEDADLTRGPGQGNGVRVHGIYFAVVSLAALVLVIAGIGLATAMR